MRLTFLLTGMLALGPIAGLSALRQGPDSQLQLEILARKFAANGQSSAAAGDRDMNNSQTWVFTTPDLCGMGASDSQPTASSYVQWRVNGRVLNTVTGPVGQQLAVQIEWERLWDGGQRLQNGPKGSHTVTLNAGNSLVLDRIVPTGSNSCKVSEVRLEASAVFRTAGRGGRGGVATGVTGGVGTGVGGGTTMGGRGGRGGVAAGGSTTTTTMSGEGRGGGRGTATGGSGSGGSTTTVTRGGGTGGGRGGATQTSDGRSRILAEMYGVGLQGTAQHTAELWLVHKQPNGPELVQQQTIRFGVKGTDYSFPPVPITTSRGVVTIDITGSLAVPLTGPSRLYFKESKTAATQGRGRGAGSGSGSASASAAASSTTEPAQPAPDQKPQVIVALSRRARAGGSEALDTSGSTSMSIAIPAPEEVLSFEFPALQKATEDLLSGHKFSIRLRITPVK